VSAADEPPGDRDRWLAAEHALGVTEGARRMEAERRMADEPAFRVAVTDWHMQLAGLLDEVEPVRPPERVWRALEREIGPASAEPSSTGPPPTASARRPGRWRPVALTALGAALGAGLVLAVLGWDALAPSGDPDLVAALAPTAEGPFAMAQVELGSDALSIRLSLRGGDEGVPQLWWIPEGGEPRPLGLLEGATDRPLRVSLAAIGEGRPSAGDALAVSLEPPGGSPTGAPTGPIVASGTLQDD
jgi:anti-sigma-K factor RskA